MSDATPLNPPTDEDWNTYTAAYTNGTVGVAAPPLDITTTNLPDGQVGVAYNQQINTTGGTAPITFTPANLGNGLLLGVDGIVSGTPTTAGTVNFDATATDAIGGTDTQALSINIAPGALNITTTTLPDGQVGVAYNQQINTTGGTAPITFTPANLGNGLLLGVDGIVSGTPTTAGIVNFDATANDSVGGTDTQALSVNVNPALDIVTTTLPDGQVGVAYNQQINTTGGTAPITFTPANLGNGLLLGADGIVSGAPTTVGTVNFDATATDSVGGTDTQPLSINIIPAPLDITTTTLPDGQVGVAYNQHINTTGGTAPITFTPANLGNGLLLGADGIVSGTPTATGTLNFDATANDANGDTDTQALSIIINPPVLNITTTTLPDGQVGVAYNQQINTTGGTAPITFTPANLGNGLLLGADGIVSGTPTTAGTVNFDATATDSVGGTDTQALSVTVNPALDITTTTLPDGQVGVAYSQQINTTGGTAPITFTPANLGNGLLLGADGIVSGTPTTAGTVNFDVTATDSVGGTDTQALSVTVDPALDITTTTLPDGQVGVAYSQQINTTGGTAPITFTPANLGNGLLLGVDGIVSGTPTTAGTVNFDATATDAVGGTDTQALSININSAPLDIITTTLPNGQVGVAYSQQINTTGGTAPITFTPANLGNGLALGANGIVSGTPTAAGTVNFDATATDANGATDTQALSIAINPALDITTTTLPDGQVGTAYNQQINTTGGTAPVTFTPANLGNGLVLGANGIVSGTPTTAGTVNFDATANDAVGATDTQAMSINVAPAPLNITTITLPNAQVGVAYNQQILTTGGTAPVTFTELDLGKGLALGTDGVVSGTPTETGTINFDVTATDANGDTDTQALSIIINAAGGGGGGGGGGSSTGAVYSTTGSALVDPSYGGTISLGGNAQINIPGGALNGTSSLTVKIEEVTSPPANPSGFRVLGTTYDVTVSGLSTYTFGSPVTLTFTFDPSTLKPGEVPVIEKYDTTTHEWINLGGTVSGNKITVTTDHLCKYAVMVKTAAEKPPVDNTKVTLTDINGHWAAAAINQLVEQGALSGYADNTVKPNNTITRAEFATIIVKAFKLESKTGKIFGDTATHWAKDNIATAAANGIVGGYDANNFGPDDLITREQMAVMVVKAANLSLAGTAKVFADNDAISTWAKSAVDIASSRSVINGYGDNTFGPQSNATRAEAIVIIVNALKG